MAAKIKSVGAGLYLEVASAFFHQLFAERVMKSVKSA
jgi:hypothetical protein